jgi:transcriptional regulator with XRE-family HTH domain
MTLDDLEEASGYSASLIGYLERGERGMNPRVMRDLATALGIDPITFGPRMWLAVRTGPHQVGSCFLSAWTWEEVAA